MKRKIICFEDVETSKLVIRAFPDNDKLNKTENLIFIEDGDNYSFPDNYFIDAWQLDKKTKKVSINKEKAIDIHINKLRIKRNEKLKELDIETTKAMQKQDKDKLSAIGKKAQQLRDMPEKAKAELKKLDGFEKIKNYIPDYLK